MLPVEDQLDLKNYMSYKQVYNPQVHRDVGDSSSMKAGPKKNDPYGSLDRVVALFLSLAAPNPCIPLTTSKLFSLATMFDIANLSQPEVANSLQQVAAGMQPLSRLDVELVHRRLNNEGVVMHFKGFWRLLEELAHKVLPEKNVSFGMRLRVLLTCLGA